MNPRISLWRGRFKLIKWAFTTYRPLAGADGSTDDPPKADPPKSDPPKADPPGDQAKTFTQAELERIVQDRVARESKKYDGFDDLKTKAAEFDKIQDQQKSELQRANERAEKAERDAAERTTAANTRLMEAAVLSEATKQKAIKPEHLFKLIDTKKVTVGDDGQVAGAEGAVKAFLEANPEYVGTTSHNGGADQGARGGTKQFKTTDGMSSAEIAKAVTEGHLDEYLKSPR